MSDDITLTPEYEFEWDDGSSRTTDEIADAEQYPEAIETLAEMGRRDPECEVTLLGFGN